ncbi:MAG TPA: PLP-dependent aminotransferase family protein [Bryobacteraceae bacterium]|jgi:GntR family transcriptional regulator/MocR family aminotransferase
MLISIEGSGPLYQRIYRSLREQILSGGFPAGCRLPVTRELARDLGVSRNVALLAYEELISEGYAVGRVGSGTYVSDALPGGKLRRPNHPDDGRGLGTSPPALSRYARRLQRMAADSPTAGSPALPYDFHYGRTSPDDFPLRTWRKLAVRHLRAPSLDYARPEGDPRLRAGLSQYLRRHRGVECEPDQIVVVNGTLQALDLAARVLLDSGDGVAVEDPHYFVAREMFAAAGAHVQAVPVDGDGLCVDRLPRAAGRLRFVYVTPSHQFPSGAILSLQRRLALLAWAARTGTYVIEDDYDSEFRYEPRPIEALQGIDRGQRVIYVGTFSRSLFPALRLGYMVLPRPLAAVFGQAKRMADRHSASWPQQALADFIEDGRMERHLRKLRAHKAVLRAALLDAIERNFGDAAEALGAGSGVHILLRLLRWPADRLDALIAAAARRGVGIYSARRYYMKPPAVSELVLGYGAMREEGIREGIRILGMLARR